MFLHWALFFLGKAVPAPTRSSTHDEETETTSKLFILLDLNNIFNDYRISNCIFR